MTISDAQKKALKAYYNKTKGQRKQFVITLPIEEYNHAQEVLKANATTPTELFRNAIKHIESGNKF